MVTKAAILLITHLVFCVSYVCFKICTRLLNRIYMVNVLKVININENSEFPYLSLKLRNLKFHQFEDCD